jgi:hypothetical protein
MPDPISHAEMIAAVQYAKREMVALLEGGADVLDILRGLRAVLAHLERTEWRPRSEIADTTLGLDADVLGFQPDIGVRGFEVERFIADYLAYRARLASPAPQEETR